MTHEELADLQQIAMSLADLLERAEAAVPGPLPPPVSSPGLRTQAELLRQYSRQVEPAPAHGVTFQSLNSGGYPLIQCLRGMLKRWEEGDPAWPVGPQAMHRQAAAFNLTREQLHALIRTDPKLAFRFRQHPACGFQ